MALLGIAVEGGEAAAIGLRGLGPLVIRGAGSLFGAAGAGLSRLLSGVASFGVRSPLLLGATAFVAGAETHKVVTNTVKTVKDEASKVKRSVSVGVIVGTIGLIALAALAVTRGRR